MGSMAAAGGEQGQVQAQPPLPPLSVECCMCGDHGLSRELFRCRSCDSRYQHKYCSDLYPKAESYRSCNWCLREEGNKNSNSSSMSSSTTSENNNSNSSGNRSSGSSTKKLQRGAFSSQQDNPVKKQRASQRLPSENTSSSKMTTMVGKGRNGFRGKIRRYKLLEEFSS